MDPSDRAKALEALVRMHELARAEPMRRLARFLWPTERILETPERLATWIYQVSGSGYHPCGTVPMGEDGAPGAATDARGRVRGVEGLFVVDASLFPTVPSANTNLTSLMFGERFGDWFLRGEL